MKKLFKLGSILMAICMIFAALSIPTSAAATEYTSGYYTYTVSNGEAEIIDYSTSAGGTVVIPSTLDGYPVTSIGVYAFQGAPVLQA